MASFCDLSQADRQIVEKRPKYHKVCIENVPEHYIGHLIGREGSRLKEIKSKFNDEVKIRMGEITTISGSNLTNVRDCERLINKLMDEIRVHGCLSKNSVEDQLNKRETLGLYIDSQFHGSLIGKNGSVIRAITEKLNVNICFSKLDYSELDCEDNNVFITGKINLYNHHHKRYF